MATLVVHGGAGAPPGSELEARVGAVERALTAGWDRMGGGALEAVIAAVRAMEDDPALNAGVGAVLNSEGEVELDAGVMEGTGLRVGAVGAVRDVRHPVDLARAVMEDGRHVLLVADGASRFARAAGIEAIDPAELIVRHRLATRAPEHDTVGAVARDDGGHVAVAVSTGGVTGKLPGRVGDSPLPGAGFYARDRAGAACGTGMGEGFMRLALCHLAVVELEHGRAVAEVAQGAVEWLLERTGARGGIILVDAEGVPAAAHSTPFMAWAQRVG